MEQMYNGIWKLISFASRTKTPAEQNYYPIESEALSIVIVCKKYHQYIYGAYFVI